VADPWRKFVERLFADHRRRLQGFFYRRLRTKSEASDLAQEVFLRMLGVRDPGAIRDPEVYLYTIASNLEKEHAILDRRIASAVDIDGEGVDLPPGDAPEFGEALDKERRNASVREAIAQLSPKCRATVLMQYDYGMSYQEIAARLGISTNMVKKYHSQAITHCRRWLDPQR